MTQTEKNISGILKHLRIYIDLRFDHACRLNPRFRQVEADLKWHEMDSVHHVLARKKPVSEFRIAVADLMVSYEHEVRRAIFMPKGQLSILNEIVPVQDELLKGKAGGGFAVHDLMTFYSAIDPALKSIMELMQTWVWWDLPDAVNAYMFESALERLIAVGRSNLEENVLQYYKTTDFKGSAAPNISSKQSIMECEFYRAEDALAAFEKRRLEDGKHQQIIARDAAGAQTSAESGSLIAQMAQRLRALEMLQAGGAIDPSLRDYYSKALQRPADEIQPAQAAEYEQRALAKAKKDLRQALMQDDGGGEPFDYKLRQYHEMKKKLEYIRGEIKPAPRAVPGAKEHAADD